MDRLRWESLETISEGGPVTLPITNTACCFIFTILDYTRKCYFLKVTQGLAVHGSENSYEKLSFFYFRYIGLHTRKCYFLKVTQGAKIVTKNCLLFYFRYYGLHTRKCYRFIFRKCKGNTRTSCP